MSTNESVNQTEFTTTNHQPDLHSYQLSIETIRAESTTRMAENQPSIVLSSAPAVLVEFSQNVNIISKISTLDGTAGLSIREEKNETTNMVLPLSPPGKETIEEPAK